MQDLEKRWLEQIAGLKKGEELLETERCVRVAWGSFRSISYTEPNVVAETISQSSFLSFTVEQGTNTTKRWCSLLNSKRKLPLKDSVAVFYSVLFSGVSEIDTIDTIDTMLFPHGIVRLFTSLTQ